MSVADLVEKFRSVALDRVEKMNLVLVGLEREAGDEEAIEEISREIHTLKGEAKMMGFADVNLVSHLTEHLILDAAAGNFAIEKVQMDLIFEGFDILRSLLTKSAGSTSDPIDLAGFVDRVAEVRHGESTSSDEKTAQAPAPPPPRREEEEPRGPRVTSSLLRIQAGGSLRIDLSKLERLGEIAGEVLLMARRVDYRLNEFAAFRDTFKTWGESVEEMLPKTHQASIRDLGHQLDAILTDVREDVYLAATRSSQLDDETRRLRHVPLAQVLSHYPRAVRDLARAQGKDVRLSHAFGDVEVDRMILTGLSDPLLHLIRNAVDHGIEPPDERTEAGKEEEGEIRLIAEYAGDSIRVVLSDDGRGIDPDRIKDKAIERGLIDANTAAAMTDQEAIGLIFESGFSTKDEVTDVSGRGIGMDVVRRQITAIGGTVEIESEVGVGTTFTIVLPLSSAISSILMVVIGDNRYGLPAKDVERVDVVGHEELTEIQGGWCVRHGGDLVALADWRGVLGGEAPPVSMREEMTVLMLRRGGRVLAVRVDEVIGEREAMTRPLGDYLADVRLCRGVALTDAGDVVPLLNVSELLAQNQLELAPAPEGRLRATMETQRAPRTKKTILVVEDSEITRSLVCGILRGLGYQVLEADDGQAGWDRLNTTHVDMVLTDVQMPRVSGLQLLERVRGDDRFRKLPVVILTTLGAPADKERAMQLGADGYLVKLNFQEKELIKTVHRYVGGS